MGLPQPDRTDPTGPLAAQAGGAVRGRAVRVTVFQPVIRSIFQPVFQPILHALSDAVLEAVAYETGRTDASTSAEAALAAGHGVCQDHAHIFIGAARLLGVPARYVSGYLLMDGVIDQQAGHAWAEAHVAGLGWVGFDVSNAICPDARYVRVAAGADYHDAAPITGVTLGSGAAEMTVEVSVAQQSQAQ